MHHQDYLSFGEDTLTCRLQASLTRLRGVCEADSQISLRAASQVVLRIYDALHCIIYTQEYRSGHNEAVLKTSFVCLCNLSKTLDFIDFFEGSIARCEKRFSQFSRKFPT